MARNLQYIFMHRKGVFEHLIIYNSIVLNKFYIFDVVIVLAS